MQYTPKNIEKTLELVQQVYFDICDFLEREKCTAKIRTFQEFETLEDFMAEQKFRLEEIEARLGEVDRATV
jgi:hypothetical protein